MMRVWTVTRTVLMAATLQVAPLLLAAEQSQVRWLHEVQDAWQRARDDRRPLLVFVTREDCLPCARMKRGTYADPRLAAAINADYVPLTIDGAKPSPLLADLAVRGFPATFVISPDAVILARVDGFVPPERLSVELARHRPKEPTAAAVEPRLPLRPVVLGGREF